MYYITLPSLMNSSNLICPLDGGAEQYESDVCAFENFNVITTGLPGAKKPNHDLACYDMKKFNESDFSSVVLMNATQLLTHLGTHTSGMCAVVLFYAVWCPFSMQMASAYNALGRTFPGIPILAVDVETQVNAFTSSQLRFGTIAVPNLLIFQGPRAIGRYNESESDINRLVKFMRKFIKLEQFRIDDCRWDNVSFNGECCCDVSSLQLTEQDYQGPMPVLYQKPTDWLLILSVLFLLFVSYMKMKT